MTTWKEHFASMNDPQSIEAISMEDQRHIRFINRLLKEREKKLKEEDEIKRSFDIKKIDKSIFLLKNKSLVKYIHNALYSSEVPLHINDIISKIKTLGWKSSSKYHTYNQVARCIRNNSYMFLKTNPATFVLREAFCSGKKSVPIQKVVAPKNNNIPRIKDVAYSIVKRYKNMYPALVHYIMVKMGYNCSYSSVYLAMQGSMFKRKNDVYYCANQGKTA